MKKTGFRWNVSKEDLETVEWREKRKVVTGREKSDFKVVLSHNV